MSSQRLHRLPPRHLPRNSTLPALGLVTRGIVGLALENTTFLYVSPHEVIRDRYAHIYFYLKDDGAFNWGAITYRQTKNFGEVGIRTLLNGLYGEGKRPQSAIRKSEYMLLHASNEYGQLLREKILKARGCFRTKGLLEALEGMDRFNRKIFYRSALAAINPPSPPTFPAS